MKTLTLLLVSLAICTSACRAQEIDYSFKETYDITTPARLMVSSSDGNIEIVPHPGDKIRVLYIARKYGKVLKIDRQELEKEFIVEVEHHNNSLEVSVKPREGSSWFSAFKDRINVSFRVYTPQETSCDLRTSDGNIALSGLTGNQESKTSDGNIDVADIGGSVTAHTSDGNIQATKIKGTLEAKTSDGNLHIEGIAGNLLAKTSDGDINLKNITGNITCATSDGNIQVADARGDVSAKTSDGHINFTDVAGALEAVTSDGNVRGTIRELKKELTIKTGDGNIYVSIPGNLGLDLNIKGESLHVPLQNFSGRSDEEVIEGKTNGGGIPVNLLTSSGNVTLDYR